MYNLRHSTATLVWYLIIYVMLVSCGQKPAKISLAERKAMDSIVSSSHNIDTLSMIQKRMEREGNMLGSILPTERWEKSCATTVDLTRH